MLIYLIPKLWSELPPSLSFDNDGQTASEVDSAVVRNFNHVSWLQVR
jgi:hypothetical protein